MYGAKFGAMINAPLAARVPAGSVPDHDIIKIDGFILFKVMTDGYEADHDLQMNEGNVKKQKAALDIYKRISKYGIAAFYNSIGDMYELGQAGLTQDLAKAKENYMLAAAQKPYLSFCPNSIVENFGTTTAAFRLGLDHLDGYGLAEQNDGLAFKWIQKSTLHGGTEPQFYLGLFFWLGLGCTKNLELARSWLEKSAKQDNPNAKYYLAIMDDQRPSDVIDIRRAEFILKNPGFSSCGCSFFLLRNLQCKLMYAANESKAFSHLSQASQLVSRGQTNEADKQFQLAFRLCPEHPEILNTFGEFLESQASQTFMARKMFKFARKFSAPGSAAHTRAESNLARTQDDVEAKLLQEVDDAKRAFQIQHGEKVLFGPDYDSVSCSNDPFARGLSSAMSFIDLILRSRYKENICEMNIREINHRIEPRFGGKYRICDVWIGINNLPLYNRVPLLMKNFEIWLNSEEALAMQPVVLAATAHFKLVAIHPFEDANGRTARFLMNLILMQNGFPPLILTCEERKLYIERVIFSSEEKHPEQFVNFVAKMVLASLRLCFSQAKIRQDLIASELNNHAKPNQKVCLPVAAAQPDWSGKDTKHLECLDCNLPECTNKFSDISISGFQQKKVLPSSDAKKTHSCKFCLKIGVFQWCSKCKKVHYCSVECQTKDWNEHKKNCI